MVQRLPDPGGVRIVSPSWRATRSLSGGENREKIKEDMTREQIAEGQKRSHELMKELEAAKAKAGIKIAPLPKKK